MTIKNNGGANIERIRLRLDRDFRTCCKDFIYRVHQGVLRRFPWAIDQDGENWFEFVQFSERTSKDFYYSADSLEDLSDYFVRIGKKITEHFNERNTLLSWPGSSPPSFDLDAPEGIRVEQQRLATAHQDAPYALKITVTGPVGAAKTGHSITFMFDADIAYFEEGTSDEEPTGRQFREPKGRRAEVVAFVFGIEYPRVAIVSADKPFNLSKLGMK